MACPPAQKPWESTKALVIDEISMVCGNLLQWLHEIAGILRDSEEFRGHSTHRVGRFFQLPPLHKWKCAWAFEAPFWKRGDLSHFELMSVYRQHEDELLAALRDVRSGHMTEAGAAT